MNRYLTHWRAFRRVTSFAAIWLRGGRGEGVPLSERDRWIVAQVAPELRRRGLLFVGLDVIGDYLTEINVTSPTCVRELDAQFGLNIAGQLFDVIEQHVIGKRHRVSTTAVASPAPDPIGATMLFSLLLHGVLLLGITFHFVKPNPSLPTLDVTLVNVANQEAPDKADFLAQANNSGGGQSDRAARPSQMFSGALPKPDPGVAAQPVEATTPQPREATPTRMVTTTGATDFSVTSDTAQTEVDPQEQTPTAADLKRQQAIAQLAAELRQKTKRLAKRPKVKYLSANTKEYTYASLHAWLVRSGQRIGNLNYPEEARQRKACMATCCSPSVLNLRRRHQEHRGDPEFRLAVAGRGRRTHRAIGRAVSAAAAKHASAWTSSTSPAPGNSAQTTCCNK